MTKNEFLVELEVAVTCFAYTLELSISLQSKQQDLEELREGANEHFKHIFKDISGVANFANVEMHAS